MAYGSELNQGVDQLEVGQRSPMPWAKRQSCAFGRARENDFILVEIADNGPGILPSDQ